MAEHTSRNHWYAWASSYNSRLQKRMPARWHCRFTHHLWNPWRPDLKAYRDQRICHVKHTRTQWEPILAYAEVVRKWPGDQSWKNTMEKEILTMIFLYASPVLVKFLLHVYSFIVSFDQICCGVRWYWIICVVWRLCCSFSVQILGFKPKRFLGLLVAFHKLDLFIQLYMLSFSDETGYVMLEAKFAQLKFVLHKFFG